MCNKLIFSYILQSCISVNFLICNTIVENFSSPSKRNLYLSNVIFTSPLSGTCQPWVNTNLLSVSYGICRFVCLFVFWWIYLAAVVSLVEHSTSGSWALAVVGHRFSYSYNRWGPLRLGIKPVSSALGRFLPTGPPRKPLFGMF